MINKTEIPKIKVGRFLKYDLTGLKFGHLTALREMRGRDDYNRIRWVCQCACTKKVKVPTAYLLNGHSESCGCAGVNNLTGKRFGKLTVLSLSKTRDLREGQRVWNCLCDCGNKTRVITSSLKNGNTKSCGCLKINNLCGENNYQAQRNIQKYGVWFSSKEEWYARACKIMDRVRKFNIPTDFSSTMELAMYLKEIEPKKCPVFGKPLVKGDGTTHSWSPSADRINPDKGYTRGNIQVISMLANVMKQHATKRQLIRFATWVLESYGYKVMKEKK